ncbi:MAG: hypothetical protein MJE77_08780 [Proteobacteria bacterium]|nr:hypothetical protein [Pseudomonadota bacterium]
MSEDGQLQGVSGIGAQFIEINEHLKRRNNTADGHRSHSGAKQALLRYQPHIVHFSGHETS